MSWCVFELSEDERASYKRWWEEHKKTCPEINKTNFGARTFCFTPLGFGTSIEVHCSCGAVHRFTDVEYND
jgi:hypothetical protein